MVSEREGSDRCSTARRRGQRSAHCPTRSAFREAAREIHSGDGGMSDIFLGQDTATGAEFCIPVEAFRTHFHLIGGTGKGKTTAIHTLLHPLLLDHRSKA